MDFNFIDLIILFLIVFFVWQGFHTGFVGGLLNIVSTVFSFGLAIYFYPDLARYLQEFLGWSENLALVVAFFAILIISELISSFLLHRIYLSIYPKLKRIKKFQFWDRILGIFPSLLVGLFLASIFLLIPLILPIKENIRDVVRQSWWGKNVLNQALAYQPQIEQVLDRLPYKNLAYIITPEPLSDESVDLNFPNEIKLVPDPASEKEMFELVNKERRSRGLNILIWDDEILKVSRAHCLDMFERGYFSHYSPEGTSPFQRMKEAGIDYTAAGENLAYAPNVDIAHQGLMESKGHRENILRAEFGRLGVGVIDGGINGKMFCQEFRN